MACLDDRGRGSAYAYLLGLYLGDGMLSRGRRDVWKLRITLDVAYPGIIQEALDAIDAVAARRPGRVARTGCVEVYAYWKHWACAFPQHGSGPKHQRRITLEPWQRVIVIRHPMSLLRGLIHSDGCRFINRVKGHAYPRYMFSNLSPEIRGLFIATCAAVGVESRPAGPRNISVARRDSVAILDAAIGPKR